ncbi:hypothetical protein PMAYCL1PPCAC_16228, partial [Pristionchus mayeri]
LLPIVVAVSEALTWGKKTTVATTTTPTEPPTTTKAPLSQCVASNYKCQSGYCPKDQQIEYSCSCWKCTCPSACIIGRPCNILVTTDACDPCKQPSACPSENYACDSSSGSAHCTCKDGYTGENCEYATTNQCASYPCINGGTCTGDDWSYTCQCPEGYSS